MTPGTWSFPSPGPRIIDAGDTETEAEEDSQAEEPKPQKPKVR